MSTVTAEPMPRATGISKSFGALKVLHKVDFHVMPGEAVGIVGPNGAGKTTLFGALAGSFPISAGTIHLGGQALSGTSPAERCRLGLARTHQVPRPFLGLTTFENVLVAARSGALLSECPSSNDLEQAA